MHHTESSPAGSGHPRSRPGVSAGFWRRKPSRSRLNLTQNSYACTSRAAYARNSPCDPFLRWRNGGRRHRPPDQRAMLRRMKSSCKGRRANVCRTALLSAAEEAARFGRWPMTEVNTALRRNIFLASGKSESHASRSRAAATPADDCRSEDGPRVL
jgi:hypothetical protein